jgi:hypothetical protein
MWVPYVSFFAFDGSTLDVSLGGRVFVSTQFSLTGLTIVSFEDPVAVQPTVPSRVKFGFPFGSIERFVSARCLGVVGVCCDFVGEYCIGG